MKPETDFAGRQIAGARENQEDCYGFCELNKASDGIDGLLLVLADGMGAYEGGSVASHIVVETFVESFCYARGTVADRLFSSFRACERSLNEEISRREKALSQMGATLVAVFWRPGALHWISVGDSALYLFRGGKIERLNADHSMAPVIDAKVASGEMSAEEGAKHPDRGVLRAALADSRVSLYDLRQQPFELEKGDIVFCASDGLASVKKEKIEELLGHAEETEAGKIARLLLQAVKDVGKAKQDNATVAVIHNRPSVGS
jgi:protein phosphatase